MKLKYIKLKDFKKQLLKNPEIRKEFQKHDLAFEIGQILFEARIIKGITQDKLADMIHTKQSGIARVESGKYLPGLRFLNKIANAFNTYLIPPKFAFMEKAVLEIHQKNTKVKNENKDINLLKSSSFITESTPHSYEGKYTYA